MKTYYYHDNYDSISDIIDTIWNDQDAQLAVEEYMFAGDVQAVQFGEANDIVDEAIKRVEALDLGVNTAPLDDWLDYTLKRMAMADMISRGEWNSYCKTIKLEEVK